MNIREEHFRLCEEVAKTSDHRTRVGCVLLRKGNFVLSTTNIMKTHPRQRELHDKVGRECRPASLHSENRALIKVREAVDTLLVCRIDRMGNLKMAKPCPSCELAIEEFGGIKNVYYTNEQGKWEEMIS